MPRAHRLPRSRLLPILAALLLCAFAFQGPSPAPPPGRVADPFAAAAANLAARLGFETTGFTPPVVVTTGKSGDAGPRIRVARVLVLPVSLEAEEGAVFSLEGNLAVVGHDDEAYAARAPYQWKVPGDKLAAIAAAVRDAAPGAAVELAGKAGIHRAFLRSRDAIPSAAIEAAFASPHQRPPRVTPLRPPPRTSTWPPSTPRAASLPSPDITGDSGYTEAPDETAHGDYMKLMAAAGLAFDYVHLKCLAEGDLRVTRTDRDAPGGVQLRVERARPILPPVP